MTDGQQFAVGDDTGDAWYTMEFLNSSRRLALSNASVALPIPRVGTLAALAMDDGGLFTAG